MVTNGRIATGVRCTTTPRRYYTAAKDHGGKVVTSRTVVLACKRPARTRTCLRQGVRRRQAHQPGPRPHTGLPACSCTTPGSTGPPSSTPGTWRRGATSSTPAGTAARGVTVSGPTGSAGRVLGENIAMGQRSPSEVVRGSARQPRAPAQHHALLVHPHRRRPVRQTLDPGLRRTLIRARARRVTTHRAPESVRTGPGESGVLRVPPGSSAAPRLSGARFSCVRPTSRSRRPGGSPEGRPRLRRRRCPGPC